MLNVTPKKKKSEAIILKLQHMHKKHTKTATILELDRWRTWALKVIA